MSDTPRNRVITSGRDRPDGFPALFTVDLDTGAHTLLAGDGTDLELPPEWTGDIAMDTLPHRILGSTGDALVAVDLTTGMHIAISDLATGTGPALVAPRGLVVDSMRQRAIAINDDLSLYSVSSCPIEPVEPVPGSGFLAPARGNAEDSSQ